MSNPNDPYVERTVIEQPATVRTEYAEPARREGSSAGWWIAALVAIVAIVGVLFMVNNRNTESQLQAARDTGRTEAMMDTAAINAQTAAASASQASQSASNSLAQAGQAAAASTAAAADEAARATREAAANVSDTASEAAASVDEPAPNQ